MTSREAAKVLLSNVYRAHCAENRPLSKSEEEYLDAVCMAIYALMKQEEQHGKHEEKECKENNPVWHDARTDPPKESGLYFGMSINSVWECYYEDGKWSLYCNPNRGIPLDILYWTYPIRNGIKA